MIKNVCYDQIWLVPENVLDSAKAIYELDVANHGRFRQHCLKWTSVRCAQEDMVGYRIWLRISQLKSSFIDIIFYFAGM